jgi:hypothetical protein
MPSLDDLINRALETASSVGTAKKEFRNKQLAQEYNIAQMNDAGATGRTAMQYGAGGASDRNNIAQLDAARMHYGQGGYGDRSLASAERQNTIAYEGMPALRDTQARQFNSLAAQTDNNVKQDKTLFPDLQQSLSAKRGRENYAAVMGMSQGGAPPKQIILNDNSIAKPPGSDWRAENREIQPTGIPGIDGVMQLFASPFAYGSHLKKKFMGQ